LRIPATQQTIAVLPVSGCIGGCCGLGIGCCSAVLAGSVPALARLERVSEILSFKLQRPPDIVPEGLARPPKSFA
jgi:hypothetical protein